MGPQQYRDQARQTLSKSDKNLPNKNEPVNLCLFRCSSCCYRLKGRCITHWRLKSNCHKSYCSCYRSFAQGYTPTHTPTHTHTHTHTHVAGREREIVPELFVVNFTNSLAMCLYCFPFHVFIQHTNGQECYYNSNGRNN